VALILQSPPSGFSLSVIRISAAMHLLTTLCPAGSCWSSWAYRIWLWEFHRCESAVTRSTIVLMRVTPLFCHAMLYWP